MFKRPDDDIGGGLGQKMNTLKVGSYFGERSLLSSEPRSFSVAARCFDGLSVNHQTMSQGKRGVG